MITVYEAAQLWLKRGELEQLEPRYCASTAITSGTTLCR